MKKGEVQLKYVKSQDNVADILTKSLGATALDNIRKKIGLVNPLEIEI